VFTDEGITLVEERAVAVESTSSGVLVRTGSGVEVSGERLLVATGRFADTGDLGLDAAGVKTDGRGFIAVDAHQRTTNPRVFAAGDVSGAPQYVYVAAQTGHMAAAGALGEPATVDYRGLPGVTFTTPQLGSAGLTEEQALAAGHSCDCRVLGAQDIPRALANRDTRGALKLVIDADTRKVLAVHAALDGAGDVMLAATYALKFGLTVDDLADTWAPYLTMAEALRDRGRAVPLRHAHQLLRVSAEQEPQRVVLSVPDLNAAPVGGGCCALSRDDLLIDELDSWPGLRTVDVHPDDHTAVVLVGPGCQHLPDALDALKERGLPARVVHTERLQQHERPPAQQQRRPQPGAEQ
jgi:hypothetical protein